METLRYILLITHFLGLAALIGGCLVQLGAPALRRAATTMLAGALVQLATGFGLTASREIQHLPVDSAKIAVKLGLAVLVLVAVILHRRRPDHRSWPVAVGLLTTANVAVAVAW
ncbi:hypothetical protein JQS43_15925 [Natronosporangium hydrolyticum]|uniref:Uncharacterized protein n=1 Tax=Natronosporangium hydrolyticum TaxID=2811111 RepID=A0A895Y9Z4_9ACTN|nr:hypothetical protein [Natronosporangium hydrolyticum]QSB13125.1 hypothetical protein JQS43_15925 [Natronosporangium hydrolyticum]